MMAVIVFFMLCAVGLFLVVCAVVTAVVTTGFSGKIEWPPSVLFGGAGGAILWYALTHAPFTISIGTL